jgi:hypothetical protein
VEEDVEVGGRGRSFCNSSDTMESRASQDALLNAEERSMECSAAVGREVSGNELLYCEQSAAGTLGSAACSQLCRYPHLVSRQFLAQFGLETDRTMTVDCWKETGREQGCED